MSKLIDLKKFYSGPEKWIQFSRDNGVGGRCILGAMDLVGIATDYFVKDDLDSMAIYEEFPFDDDYKKLHPLHTNAWGLADWNNAPERKFEDILSLIDRAIARRSTAEVV